jgi:hypothetical protein
MRNRASERPDVLVRIFVTEEAFESIKATLPVGSVAFEPEITKAYARFGWSRSWGGLTRSPFSAMSMIDGYHPRRMASR